MRHWRKFAACLGTDGSIFFPTQRKFSARTWRPARAICETCTVREECLAMALSVRETDDRWGMFGGMTPSERRLHRRSLRKQPR